MAGRTLRDILEARAAASVLLIGETDDGSVADYLEAHPELDCRRLPIAEALARVAETGARDLALVSGLEQLSRADAAVLLGRLRDLHARAVLVLLDPQRDAPWSHADMIGHGYSRVGDWAGEQHDRTLYRFDITDYKTTPDWLNDKHWANPELFDKHRW